ncbi:FAD/NAD(P)-binding protein [Paractinoplanes durhamensis]|uniref:FAD/NAD(P)-binding protein n=1 Tax=Paractinoplanes durhamensis TaxID=113563 RepID=UPI0019406E56|nr:FAD/NAD(P)-binding protein [Actinoplanes durhamensis]
MTEPVPYRVTTREAETADTVTIELAGPVLPEFRPGQFAMLTAYGIGEVPISLSGGGSGGRLVHTLRNVGAVTAALYAAGPGEVVGVRGPFGVGWDLASARGHDVVIVAGGIGLAPLRPVVAALLARPADFGRVSVLIGARTPADLLFPADLRRWGRHAQVEVIVDRPADGWAGDVGLVTTLIPRAEVDPAAAVAFVCGPEVMMRFVAEALRRRGIAEPAIGVSLERDMKCGAGWCGHCQLGPLLLCRDGPVVRYDTVEPLLRVREM